VIDIFLKGAMKMKTEFFAAFIMLFACAAAAGETPGEAIKPPRVTIPGAAYYPTPDGQWHGNPPGFKRDWGWTQFAKIDDFRLREGGKPTQKTEVFLFYTPRSLYIAAILHDANIAKLRRGVSPADYPKDAPLDWLGDVFEVFIRPDPSSPVYYQFGVNPNGARFDQAWGKGAPGTVSGAGWDARWSVGAKVYKDRWQLEMCIDFSSLTLGDRFIGTPGRGDEMAVTFCRSAGAWKEYSSWGVPGTWHKVEKFGRIVFGPRLPSISWKNNPFAPDDVIVSDVDAGDPDFGERKLTAKLTNPGKKEIALDVEFAVGDSKKWSLDPVKTAKQTLKVTLAAGASRTIEIPYKVTEGRGPEKSLYFSVKRPELNGPSYYADYRFTIFPLEKKLAAMRAVVDRIRTECAPHAAVAEAKKCAARAAEFSEQLKTLSAPGVKPRGAIARAKTLEPEIKKFRTEFANVVRPAVFAAKRLRAKSGFCVGTAHSTVKVLDDEPFEGKLGGPADIALAKAEYESAQFVILAVDPGLKEVTCEVGEIVGPGGAKIARENIEVFRVGTVTATGSLPFRQGLWPDPLYPANKTPVKVGVPQSMIVTVYAPRDQKAGRYRGVVHFTADGSGGVDVPLEVEVFDFALGRHMTLFNEIWADSVRPNAYYGDYTPELFEKFVRVTAQYRMPISVDLQTVQRKLRFKMTANGEIECDFSDVDPYFEIMHKYGRERVNINFYCSWLPWKSFLAGAMWYYVPGRSQARLHVPDDPLDEYGRFLKKCHDHLVALGFKSDRLYYSGGDEPWAQKVRDEMRPGFEIARKRLPKIKRTSAAAHPGMKDLRDIIDIWCPQIREFNPKAYADDPRELWMYTCGWKFPPYPCYSLPVPGIATRITGWLCRKYGATAFLYWGTNVWVSGNEINVQRTKPFAEKHWVKDGWKPALGTGDGVMVYPTPDGPIPSLRMMLIRDGTEDYEYLTILGRLAAKARGRGAPKELVEEADRLARVPKEVLASPTVWTKDAETLEKARRRAARLIVRLEK